MKFHTKHIILLLAIMLLMPVAGLMAQKKHLAVEDYDQWQSLRRIVLSDDGQWLAYNIGLVEGDGWMVLAKVATGSEDTMKLASQPAFSGDNKWLAFRIGYSEKEEKRMEKAKVPVRYKMGLYNLTTAAIDTFEGVSSFAFNEKGDFLAMKKYKPKGVESGGTDLVLRNLGTGMNQLFGNVADFKFNEDDGSMLAMVIDADKQFGNGVHLLSLENNSLKVLDSHKAEYKRLTWNEEGNSLAFLRSVENEDYEEDNHLVFSFTGLDKKNIQKAVYDPAEDADFTDGYRIVSERRLDWSDDGKTVFFGVKEWKKKEDSEKKEEEKPGESGQEEKKKEDKDADLPPPGVDVWHWKDEPVQPRQQKLQNQLKDFNYLAAWHIDANKFVQVNSGDIREVYLTGDEKHAIGYDQKPYEPVFEDRWRDIYLIDVMTGEKTLVMEKHLSMSGSAGGKYLLYFKDNEWWSYDIKSKTHTNLTKDIPAKFENDTRVAGIAQHQPWGSGRWYKDDKAVILYSEYDVYRVSPDGGKTEQLTAGTDDKIRFRVRIMDLDEDYFEPGQTLYVTAYGDRTKDSGYYRLAKGRNLEKLVYEPRMISALTQADDAEVFYFIKQKADESPNVFVAGKDFSNPKQMTHTNLQQADYYWAGTELINYTNKNGVELQGRLLYPENYQPGRKYPMLVYIYELRSQSLHSYTPPTRSRAYNQRRFSAEGFFVYEPDIVYRINDPGFSAVECVVPAVEEVLKTGMVDREKIGLTGHSWGAYQTCFIVTQTDLFNAAVAGAPLINMVSMSLSIYWNTGTPNLNIFETSQGRLIEPFWEIKQKYWDNSPLYQSNNIKTPLLIAFGDNDGAVDWNQGVEMYNAMRRQQKPFVMLVYAGENHGLAKKENQIDYATRMHDWMRHYLLGDEPADWIVKGVPFLDKPKPKDKK